MQTTHLEDVLPAYYSRLFPFEDLYEWLSYGDPELFKHREFAFNFEGVRYSRNRSYNGIKELKTDVKWKKPYEIDIGAVYNISPSVHEKQNLYPIQKELIFDLDLTDYDEIRICCSQANICSKCWKYMTISIKILDEALREDFGFEHILWTFSGRRGVHCWICDKKARLLRKNGRFGVANYLYLVIGGEYTKKKVKIDGSIHHSVKRALKVIEPLFLEFCVVEQDMLGTQKRIEKFLGIIDETLQMEVQQLFNNYQTSVSRWQAFVEYFRNKIELKIDKWCETPFLIEEIMIQYAYPRLDINVSLGINHLLKLPFSVHPKTGKIGIVLNPYFIECFDPSEVPTVTELFEEINEYDATMQKSAVQNSVSTNVPNIMKTSLRTSLILFRAFLYNLKLANLK